MQQSLNEVSNKRSDNKLIGIFLIVWIILNAIQASFVELHADEAYYWIYSKFLDWGYFDHPPMVALYIKAGDSFVHNMLSLRLATIFSTGLAIYILWLILKEYARNAKLFILLFCCFLLFHVYGFITTPDSPLFLFSVLFFYLYKKYAEKDSYKFAIYLALTIALMLYSKYHGVLILFFTILSNFSLLKRKSFWLIVIVSALLFLPHIWWQIQNGLPSIHYHLFDRSAKPYKLRYTTEYLLGQLFVSAPLLGWFFFWIAAKVKTADPFMQALKFNFFGVFLFFLLSTFKGDIEPHWTLIAYPPMFMLSYYYLTQKSKIPVWFTKVAIANVVIILIARLVFVLPVPYFNVFSVVRKQKGSVTWAHQIKEKAENNYVIFDEGFQEPSKYNYYNNTLKGFSYDSRSYRKNQFDIWPIEDSLRHKRVYYAHRTPYPFSVQDSFQTTKGKYYGVWLDNVRLYQKVEIKVDEETSSEWNRNEQRELRLSIYNPYDEEIAFNNTGEKWKCYFEYGFLQNGRLMQVVSLGNILESVRIPAKQTVNVAVQIRAPKKPGKYKLIFSLRTDPFPGARNSPMIGMKVK